MIVNSLDGTFQQTSPLLYYNPSTPMTSIVDPSLDPSKGHYHSHMKSPANSSQTLPRRCSVGPMEPTGSQANDGMYVSFSKAPKSSGPQANKVYTSPLAKATGHVDCVQGGHGGVESVPLLVGNEAMAGGPDQANLPLKPHEICLVSNSRQTQ